MADLTLEQKRAIALATARMRMGQDEKPQGGSPFTSRTYLEGAKGLGEGLLSLGSGFAGQVAGGLAGIGAAAVPGGRSGAEMVEDVSSALTYQPRSAGGKNMMSTIATPLAAVDDKLDFAGDKLGGSSPLAETAIYTALSVAPMLLGGKGAKPRVPSKPAKVPTTAELKTQAGRAYKAADESGVIIGKDSFSRFVEDVKQTMANEGIDATLHPDSMAAMKRLMREAGNNFSLKGAEIVRRVIGDAAKSTKPADRRMATIMRRKFDDYMDNLGQSDIIAGDAKAATAALSEARNLWTRTKKAEVIEKAIEKAGTRASQFTGSGYENALRTQFRQIAMNDKKMRMFTEAEQAAIKRVAEGGAIGNALRRVGSFAPRGPVSGVTGLAAESLAPGAGLALWGSGELSRLGATALTSRNARLAAEMMRRGGAPTKPQSALPGPRQQAIAALLAQESN